MADALLLIAGAGVVAGEIGAAVGAPAAAAVDAFSDVTGAGVEPASVPSFFGRNFSARLPAFLQPLSESAAAVQIKRRRLLQTLNIG